MRFAHRQSCPATSLQLHPLPPPPTPTVLLIHGSGLDSKDFAVNQVKISLPKWVKRSCGHRTESLRSCDSEVKKRRGRRQTKPARPQPIPPSPSRPLPYSISLAAIRLTSRVETPAEAAGNSCCFLCRCSRASATYGHTASAPDWSETALP